MHHLESFCWVSEKQVTDRLLNTANEWLSIEYFLKRLQPDWIYMPTESKYNLCNEQRAGIVSASQTLNIREIYAVPWGALCLLSHNSGRCGKFPATSKGFNEFANVLDCEPCLLIAEDNKFAINSDENIAVFSGPKEFVEHSLATDIASLTKEYTEFAEYDNKPRYFDDAFAVMMGCYYGIWKHG